MGDLLENTDGDLKFIEMLVSSLKKMERFADSPDRNAQFDAFLVENYKDSLDKIKKALCASGKKLAGCPSAYMSKLEAIRLCTGSNSCINSNSVQRMSRKDWVDVVTPLTELLMFKSMKNASGRTEMDFNSRIKKGFEVF